MPTTLTTRGGGVNICTYPLFFSVREYLSDGSSERSAAGAGKVVHSLPWRMICGASILDFFETLEQPIEE